MKRNLLKSLALVAALTMTLSLTACQPKTEDPAQTGTEESADLSDEDYVAKVTEIYTAIQTEGTAAMEGLDQTDPKAVAEGTKAMVESVKPYYEELAALKTSGKFVDAQAQITAGATASIQMLDLSLEMLEIGLDPANATNEEALKKGEEITAQITTLATDAQQLTTGITAVMGDAAETPAE